METTDNHYLVVSLEVVIFGSQFLLELSELIFLISLKKTAFFQQQPGTVSNVSGPTISSSTQGGRRLGKQVGGQMSTLEDEEITEVQPSRLQQNRQAIDSMRLLYEQDRLLQRVDQMLRNFDAELRLVRHDKMALDTRLMKADLRQLTLYEEFLLLKEFEKSEKGLANKVEMKQQEKLEMQVKVREKSVFLRRTSNAFFVKLKGRKCPIF